MLNERKTEAYCAILAEELRLATGCTEPIAVAYCAAKLREVLGGKPEKVLAEISGNILKNVKSVVVPNTGGRRGIEAAIAVGIVAGDPEAELQVLAKVTEEDTEHIQGYLDSTDITVTCPETPCMLDIRLTGWLGGHKAVTRVANNHTNLVYIEKDGQVLLEKPESASAEANLQDKSVLNVKDILTFIETVPIERIRPHISRQLQCNSAIAAEGLRGDWGANIGSVMLGAYGDDVKVRACACAAAASDARMSGCELPVVINSGSGNQGITVSVPLIVYARELGSSDEQLYRALVLSNLVAIHQKTGIGRLSAFCGAVCAGAAAGAGIAYLDGGGYKEACHAVVNALSIVAGMVCDGAKPSCAGKIAFSVNAGILGYVMYRDGQQFYGGDGIVKKGVENTIDSIARLGRDGMRATNDEIIRIMLGS